MEFTLIDQEKWERKLHYEYYTNLLKCGYNVTVELDLTKFRAVLKEKGLRFFPSFVYCVSAQIRDMKEFRMGRDAEGRPGYYDRLHPNYTIFHEDDHTFSDLWTEFCDDFGEFYRRMTEDMETYKDKKGVKVKPGQPANFYCISNVPWLSFTGYAPYTQSGVPLLLPIITTGRFKEKDGVTTMPFSINISHAAADGYHTSMFIDQLQKRLDAFRPE